ncbi:MAG: leucine-rich repeat domain-containing protein [Bacilli bacterium]|nr:leucine-rich repeat domain-containing protein [Bacilli bacterium]
MRKMFKRGFTLTELLAIIVILIILAVMLAPLIGGVIDESRKQSYKSSAYGLIKGAEFYFTENSDGFSAKKFTINDGTFIGDSFIMTGVLPDYGIINVTADSKVKIIAIYNDWCVYKNYEDVEVTLTSDLNKCTLPTSESCFAFDNSTGTITGYYEYEENNPSNPSCPDNIILPSVIDNVLVEILGTGAFEDLSITNLVVPDSVVKIENFAFANNIITNISLSDTVQVIGESAFYGNQIPSLTVPGSVEIIDSSAFEGNQISELVLLYGTKAIENSAFLGNQIDSLVIPSSIVTIENDAFSENDISNIIIFGNDTNLPSRFDSRISAIGWGDATIDYVIE